MADLHIGKQVDGISMVKEDQPFVLQGVLDILREREVEALVLAGDIYDKASPSEEAVRLFDWFLSEVAALGVPCLAIPGNHDSADRLAYARTLLEKQGVFFPPAFDGKVSKVLLSDADGPVAFWLLPFIRPVDVKRFFPDASIGNDYTAAMKAVLDAAGVDPSERNVLVAHQFVTCSGTVPDRASEELNLGGLDNVDASAFDAFDYVALGHIHRAQRVGRDTVRYAGSPLKYSIGEARYDKSAVLVDIGAKTEGAQPGDCVSFELVPLAPLHDMREIKGPLDTLVSPEVFSAGDADDYVRVVLTDEGVRLDAIERVRAAYPNYMGIAYESDLKRAVTQGEAEGADLEELDPQELFSAFFEKVVGRPLDERESELALTCMQATLLREKEDGR